jgi:hypothetical protein
MKKVIEALFTGCCSDPFSTLGMHCTDAGLEVRALLPDATDVWVIEPKTGAKSASWNALICAVSLAAFCRVVKILFAISWPPPGTDSSI